MPSRGGDHGLTQSSRFRDPLACYRHLALPPGHARARNSAPPSAAPPARLTPDNATLLPYARTALDVITTWPAVKASRST